MKQISLLDNFDEEFRNKVRLRINEIEESKYNIIEFLRPDLFQK